MGVFDIDELIKEIDPDNPVGDDLEWDPEFVAMEALANSGGDQSMIEGANLEEVLTDWKGIRKAALSLLARSKDIRTVVFLVRSSLVCDGVAGFRDALLILREILGRYWDQLHPQLDPDDDFDPTMRVNTIATLCGKPETLDLLVSTPLVLSNKVGTFCYKDIQFATGELTPPADEYAVPTMALISAACLDSELEDLKLTETALKECLQYINTVDQQLIDKTGSSSAPDLSMLTNLLLGMDKFMSEQLAKRGVSVPAVTEGETTMSDTSISAVSGQSGSGEILNRTDAIRMMDKIGKYYFDNEPSSPIPLLMQRAKRLSSMDFMSILKDLAPDGLSQAENVAGSDRPDE
jgi:type VI secretion system protein ImpA